MISHRIGCFESLQSEGIKASLFRKFSSTCSSKGEHDNILGFSSFLSWNDGKVSYGRWELLRNYWVLISVKYFSFILRRISTSSLPHRRMSRACCNGDELVPSPFLSKHESGGTVFITPWKRILLKKQRFSESIQLILWGITEKLIHTNQNLLRKALGLHEISCTESSIMCSIGKTMLC